jgi:Tfp pilus assembly protein FimT
MMRPQFFGRWLQKTRSDAGVTLMELMVGLTIMTIFMGMFTGAAVMMYNSTSKAEAIGETASQLSIAFSRLDTSVRYASAISQPGTGMDGNTYVEWQSTYSGATNCTQLRFDVNADQLQQRTWTVAGAGTYSALTNWLPFASGVTTGATSVFTRDISTETMPHQQLRIYLIAQSMGRTGPTTSVSDVTFTAFNSSDSSPTDICTEVTRA